MISKLKAPFFVKPYTDTGGGVDFLGYRAVNLDLMGEFFPSINNVTRSIRPYSLLAWIAWVFREEKQAQGAIEATRAEFDQFREKLEVLFGWSHQINKAGGGLVGNAQLQPRETGSVSLRFQAWGRKVSWLDAVNYGPSLKVDNGLGFLAQVKPGVFTVTEAGEQLAQGLDASLRGCDRYDELRSLDLLSGSAELADSLYPHWMVNSPSKAEADAFREVLFAPVKAGERNRIGRRSAAISLILSALKQQEKPVTVAELRRHMTLHDFSTQLSDNSFEALLHVQGLWRVLQVRQAQRLAAESLFGWMEGRILGQARNLSSQLVDDLLVLLKEEGRASDLPEHWLNDELQLLESAKGNADSYLDAAKSCRELDFFHQMDEISNANAHDRDRAAVLTLKLLILCAELTRELEHDEHCKSYLKVGGATRISLVNWKEFVLGGRELPIKTFLIDMIENYFLSQHFGIAAARYSEGTQRLRITIEEGGLVSMLNSTRNAWRPSVTPDRLGSALALMTDSKLVTRKVKDGQERYSHLASVPHS